MKRRIFWSLSAMLAGAGLAAAQDTMPTSAASDLYLMPAQNQVPAPVLSQPACMTGGCNGYGLGADSRFYVRAEYLLWRLGSQLDSSGRDSLPSIRTTMPIGIASRSIRESLVGGELVVTTNESVNQFTTATLDPVLFAGSNLDAVDRNGGRITVGYWFQNDFAVEGSYFGLERRGSSFIATAGSRVENFTNGLQDIVQQPVFDQFGNIVGTTPTQQPTSFPLDVNVSAFGESTSRIYGAELGIRHRGYTVGVFRFSELYGFRYLNYDETQNLAQIIQAQNGTYVGTTADPTNLDPVQRLLGVGEPTSTILTASQSTRNQFFGFQVGVSFDADWGSFFWNGFAKVGVGATRQETHSFESAFSTAGPIPAAIYPPDDNPLDFKESRTRLSWVPNVGTSVGYNFTNNLRGFIGYEVMMWSRVVRPVGSNTLSNNGSGTVTLANTGGANNGTGTSMPLGGPAQSFTEGQFWVHGLNFGLEYRF
jgi:hypothetical protein